MIKVLLKRRWVDASVTTLFGYLFKWMLICLIIGALAGSASALFLWALDWATNWREANIWIIALLPLGGLIIGLTYYYWGENVVKGNNQLLDEFHSPKKIIPLRMAPLVLFGTIATHFFGGSAGREGTAVQMGGAIADQFTKLFKLRPRDRKVLLSAGVSAGFASVFGTPLAGAVFALEVFVVGRVRYEGILPAFLAAFIANWTCHAWQIPHTVYTIPFVPEFTPLNLVWAILAGIVFGFTARAFSFSARYWANLFKKIVSWPPLRPVLGGAIIALAVWLIGNTRYIGLGVPVIVEAFEQQVPWFDFIAKILFTTFTLGAGFKGGEVTPLFFIGATLGNLLSLFVPLPMALLAGMGFVAVFAGATNTPLACTFMGLELFGAAGGAYIATACVMAYLFSGHTGIYGSQIIGSPKHIFMGRQSGKMLDDI